MINKLFLPGKIGSMELRNRIIMPPMGTMQVNDDSTVSDQMCRYYAARSKGSAGLIIVEYGTVAPRPEGDSSLLGLYNDRFIPGLSKLVNAVHQHGAKIAIEINNSGRALAYGGVGSQPVSPSAIVSPTTGLVPRELSTEEAEQLVEAYAEGVRRARDAGFDAVEFHGAHGYLICQFLSAHNNKRTDKYGGDIYGRATFAIEIVKRSREKVGRDFPLIFRISADEGVDEGLTIDQTKIISKLLEEAGINCIDVSAGTMETLWTLTMQTGDIPAGCLVPYAQQIKQAVEIPVSVVGRINDPAVAIDIIETGKSDFVSIGRGLIADPEFPVKALNGRANEIRKCIACMYCTDMTGGYRKHIACSVNPVAGRESELMILSAMKKKKVLVVGGGPAGMEAARVAALRGHKVTLWEEESELGGQLLLAAVPRGKQEFLNAINYYRSQFNLLKVNAVLGKKVTAQAVKRFKPDVVILATGSFTVLPEVEGAYLMHVVLARDIMAKKSSTGKRVVVAGSGRIGCETAVTLAEEGKEVVIIGGWPGELGGSTLPVSRGILLTKLRKHVVGIEPDFMIEKITAKGVVANKEGCSKLIEADTVVLSPASMCNRMLLDELKSVVSELYVIGDAEKIGCIGEATLAGFRTASSL